jgi:hypothetical protein
MSLCILEASPTQRTEERDAHPDDRRRRDGDDERDVVGDLRAVLPRDGKNPTATRDEEIIAAISLHALTRHQNQRSS